MVKYGSAVAKIDILWFVEDEVATYILILKYIILLPSRLFCSNHPASENIFVISSLLTKYTSR